MAWSLMDGIANGAADLAAGDSGKFLNAVALKVAPPRSSKSSKPDGPAKQAETPPPEQEDTRSPMQKLMDKFR